MCTEMLLHAQYYLYETYAPSGTNPPHSVTCVTTRVSSCGDAHTPKTSYAATLQCNRPVEL